MNTMLYMLDGEEETPAEAPAEESTESSDDGDE